MSLSIYYFISRLNPTATFPNVDIIFLSIRKRRKKPQISPKQTPNHPNPTRLRSGRRTSNASGTRRQTGTSRTSSPPKTGRLLGALRKQILETFWATQQLRLQRVPLRLSWEEAARQEPEARRLHRKWLQAAGQSPQASRWSPFCCCCWRLDVFARNLKLRRNHPLPGWSGL